MHNYKGSLRREHHDNTPTKTSWDQTRDNPQPQPRYEPRNDPRNDQRDARPDQRDNRPDQRDNRYDQKESKYESKEGKYEQRNERYDTRNDSRNEIRNESRYEPKYERSELSYYQSQSSRVYYDHEREERPSAKSQQQQPGGLAEDKYFYNSLLPVVVRAGEREEHEQRLRVVIQARAEKGQHQLQIHLTDDANPKFLWAFAVKEVDFLTLKNSQKLKVSYAGFPEMLENCLRDCEQPEAAHFLVLETRKGEGKLQFLESGRYRVTNHLELTFKLASDEELKDHLAGKLLTACEEIDQNRSALRSMEHTLNERMKEMEKMNSELNALLAEREQARDQHRLELTQKRTELEASKLSELTKAKKEAEAELKELKQRLGAEIDALTKQKTDLSSRLSEARERVSVLEGVEREQTMKVARLEQDCAKSGKEADQLRAENRELSERRFQNEKTITELSCRIDSLRSELEDKKTIITSTVQLKETNHSQISSLEQLANDQKKQLARTEQRLADAEAETAKLATANAELLEKLGRQKEKLQERGEIIKEQEKELKELKKAEGALQRDNERLTYDREDRDNKVKALQDQLERLQKKFEEEQAMVAYLQKSLNERPGLRTNYYPPTATTYTPPSTATSYLGRDGRDPSQLSTNSNIAASRLTTSQRPEQRTDKYEPNIKRYEERSKSPLPSRLPQQRDPEDEEDYSEKPSKFDKPIPVKFKMSQPKE